jgi:hypothetical protein
MRINAERIEISPSEVIFWEEVKSMKLLNKKLAIELASGRVVEVGNLLPSSIDLAFRTYEHWLSEHLKKENKITKS